MSYRRRFDIMLGVDREGRKPRWVRLGSAFERENGRIDGCLDVIPVGPWDGTFCLFEARAKEGEGGGERPPQARPPQARPERREGGWKKPDDYVPKVHAVSRTKGRGLCDKFAKPENLTDDWNKVTCKLCLKAGPAQSSQSEGTHE